MVKFLGKSEKKEVEEESGRAGVRVVPYMTRARGGFIRTRRFTGEGCVNNIVVFEVLDFNTMYHER